MMKRQTGTNNEEGFVLVAALMIMLVLTIIGIAANRNTSIELGIAGNDRTHKETFYNADGGTELASEVLEQNIACLAFEETSGAGGARILAGVDNDHSLFVQSDSLGFWRNFDNDDDFLTYMIPSDTNRNFYYPVYNLADPTQPHTNFIVNGNTKITTGAAIQMAAGYEGRGKGIGIGGASLIYNINTHSVGKNGSETVLGLHYRHSLGQEGDCLDDF